MDGNLIGALIGASTTATLTISGRLNSRLRRIESKIDRQAQVQVNHEDRLDELENGRRPYRMTP